jgi:hypothetical protein
LDWFAEKEKIMIVKIIMLPFWLLKKGVGTVFGILRLVLGVGAGAVRFLFGRRVGTVLVLVAAFFLGKKYLENKAKTIEKS